MPEELRDEALLLGSQPGDPARGGMGAKGLGAVPLRDAEGRTPLYRAIEGRHADVIEMLQAAALAKKLGVTPEENDMSRAIAQDGRDNLSNLISITAEPDGAFPTVAQTQAETSATDRDARLALAQ